MAFKMENIISWFEIPAVDFKRAVQFYKTVLNFSIEEVDMHGTKMGIFPMIGKFVSGAIVKGEGYVPSAKGTRIYLNGGNDLNTPLSRVEGAGGKVVLQKTLISPEVGHFAIFKDSEGNLISLHSMN